MDDEGEDLLVFTSFGKEPFAQSFGFWIGQRIFANAVETDEQSSGESLACFDGRGDSDLAGIFEKVSEFLAEAQGLTVGVADGCEFLGDFLARLFGSVPNNRHSPL